MNEEQFFQSMEYEKCEELIAVTTELFTSLLGEPYVVNIFYFDKYGFYVNSWIDKTEFQESFIDELDIFDAEYYEDEHLYFLNDDNQDLMKDYASNCSEKLSSVLQRAFIFFYMDVLGENPNCIQNDIRIKLKSAFDSVYVKLFGETKDIPKCIADCSTIKEVEEINLE